jgi:hypothetical protein
MHTGIISFADRVAYNIKSNDIKDEILSNIFSLYGIRIIQKHYFKLDENNAKYINKIPHLICLRTNGNPYYIFFTKNNDVPIIYFIDKKIHPGYEKPRIILSRGMFDTSLFENTLIDGEMVKTNNGKWIFIINDIFSYEGKKLDNKTLPERLKIIYEMLDTKYTPDNTCDVCDFKIKNYYFPSKKSINDLIELSKKLNYTCRGIYFWSYNFKHKPKLYNFNEDIIISVNRKSKDITEFKELENKISVIPNDYKDNIISTSNIEININVNNNEEKILWVTKTDDADVYNLYDNENIITSTKIGIAFIPNLQTSKMMRNVFKEKNASFSIKYKCIYNSTFNKYQPIEISI